ncbi:uncharacterized protein LOC110857755 [Folsomia candida]|uniref:Uncharacterized protein n=1 Tax=Folsomia candida TaxID=158441 RepID=A0A226DJI7_FOLCA|nr:uncharacterized protein LOC110857755 [Folsomia candida]OXA44751.1 hypothetical protein Fcan01_20727 [Folsomia candida]
MSLSISEVDQLITKADNHGAKFMENCHPKNKGLWKSRAARSSDVVIVNKTKFHFKLTSESKSSGVWTEEMLPVSDINPKRSVLFGCQSRGFMTGCTECCVSYKSKCGNAEFTVYTSNPFVGAKHAGAKFASNVTVATNLGQQNNNMVCFTVT